VVGASAIDTTGVVRIASDQPPITARIDDLWLDEGDSGQAVRDLTITLSQPVPAGHSASIVATTSPSSASAGSDFATLPPTTVVFGPGEASATVSVTTYGDTVGEGVETFSVALSGAVGVVLEDTAGSVSLLDDEGPVTAALVDASVAEGNSGTGTGTVTLQLSAPVAATGQSFTVQVATTTGGTATPSTDYTTVALTTRTLSAGQDSLTIDVPVKGDTTPEQDETIRVTVSTATGGLALVDTTADLTIRNDD
jgi:hypothetical protein